MNSNKYIYIIVSIIPTYFNTNPWNIMVYYLCFKWLSIIDTKFKIKQ